MTAILILFIISFQFALGYFGVKYLTCLNNRLIELNNSVLEFSQQIEPNFEKARTLFKQINSAFETFFENQSKIKLCKNIMLFKSVVVAIILFKKRKSILSFFSLYDIVSKFTKSILEF